MKKSFKYIILSYGLFLGWLLSFPYNGPILVSLAKSYEIPVASYSLTYTVAPSIFLVIYSFLKVKEDYAKKMMVWCISICIFCSLIVFTSSPVIWHPIFALMGICSVVKIIGWSYFFTMEIPIEDKLSVMALVIITGNIVYYFIKILNNFISFPYILVILLSVLGFSLWATLKTEITSKIEIKLENEPFPKKLIFIICLFLFIINLNHGLAFHAVYPSFDHLFMDYFIYYGILPYIITLLIMYIYSKKISGTLPVFLGTSFLGLGYLLFALMEGRWYYYFIIESLMQSGWAMLDLYLWTLFGLIASIYGRPLIICGYAFLANLSGVFAGGILGLTILDSIKDYYLLAASFAIGIIFIAFIIVPWLNNSIEKDLRNNLLKSELQIIDKKNRKENRKLLLDNLAGSELLTPREKEVAELLLQGHTNKKIAEILEISDNTMKTHARNIYSKLNVSNKRELLLKYTNTS